MKDSSLFGLESGQSGILSRLKQVSGKEGLLRNLLDMGFLPGTKITVLEKYPKQEKLVVEVGLVKLALRKSEAELLELE
ncbi:ferrous iron transport protein A [Leptospira wolffii]|uniref:Ferrous iron transport protein A n=1 Tax=Leptospira wolffii TaxID=409998 RepID=A0A2M9ZD38_9LEPT|nr:FeoA family protein [Leptospira wolffii]PJZ66348.1 iron transporter FeoA [Leptospira wolffii]TGK60096.1 ferrous iron transport protein A [Leptospira wolffii]TGK72439.1 ferrous iron transport protein A [Leptospira wolffii]TGK76103.1 ferrous iron transport protein A [Leptospira wolffii]TGL30355.1 ferrous iron transport protein A [Leptospira wolffii]